MRKVFCFRKNSSGRAKDVTTSGDKASLASRTVVSPTSGAMVAPAIQGSSGMEARRPTFQDKDMNAIHKAAREGKRWRMKQILFFRTSDLNARDEMGRTALHLACAYGHPRMVRLLLKRHCIMDFCDDEKKTALIHALQYQNTECAHVLLNYGPNLHIKDNDGNTALHYAVLCHSKAIVEQLLMFGADMKVRNKNDLTPLALAKLANHEKMVEFLVSRGAKYYEMKRKQQLTSEYKEERRPGTSQCSNLATDLQESSKSAQTKTKSKTADEISAEGSLNSKQQLTSEYEGRTQTLESGRFVDEISEKDSLRRLSSKSGIDDAWPISHNEDFKDKVILKTCTLAAKTSENQSKQIHLPPLHLEKMTQESQINRACYKEDTSAYSGHPSVQRAEEMCLKQGTLEQRKNLQLSKDESKQKSHEFSVKLKMTECPEEEPPRDNSKGGASLRQMPSNLTSKMLNCEGKDAFGMSVSAALQTFPEREETTLKIVSPSHADPGSQTDSPSWSSSELPLREKELHSENDHKPVAEHVLNKNEESFYNDTENKKVRHQVVTSEVIEDQEFAKQMTKNMKPNTTDWKLDIGPTPRSSDPKIHVDLWLVGCNETKPLTELKSHDMPAVTNTYKETKPNQDLFQKPLCADNCSANNCKSVDSKLKDESSSALHNDGTSGVDVIEELQQDFQRLKNNVDMLKAEHLAWKKAEIQLQKEFEEKMEQKSGKREASGTMCDGADESDSIGLSQQSNSEHTDNQQPSDEINENTVIFLNKVEEKKEQKNSKKEVSETMCNADDDSDSGDSERTDKQQVSIMKDEDYDRFTSEEEKEERQKVDLLYEKNRVQLRRNEEHSIKEVEMNPHLETTIRTRDIVSETVRENEVVEERNHTQNQLSQEQNATIIQDGILTKHLCKPKKIEISHKKMNSEVSENSDKEKSLLHENRLLWDEIAKLRLEIDTIKNQSQEMGKKYFEDIALVKEKNDILHKIIRETAFQHNVQLEVLRAKNKELNCKLENEQQNRGRLEAEVESYRSRLATAVQDHEHCQTSKGDLQLAFQRERDEWFCLRDKINFDVSNLKQNNEILSQQLSKVESKISSLETELHRTRDALRERTLVLEKDLSQKHCQKKETEKVYEEEQ